MTESDSYFGIDIGTTSVKVAYVDSKSQQIVNVKWSDGTYDFPSYYSFNTRTNKSKFGRPAKEEMSNPNCIVGYEVKRFIGKKYDDESIAEEKQRVTYKVIKNTDDGSILIQMGPQQSISPGKFYECILCEIKKSLRTSHLMGNNAVVTVPVTFGNKEREIIQKMIKSPAFGMNEVIIANEPTAAAIDFGIKDSDFEGTFAVFDYGGGTLDVSIIDLTRENGEPNFTVLCHDGLRGNGGSDLDDLIKQRILEGIEQDEYTIEEEDKEHILKFLKERKGGSQLKSMCEQIKIKLTLDESVSTTLPTKRPNSDPVIDINFTRNDFEAVCAQKFNEAVSCLSSLIEKARTEKRKEVTRILMVGGSSQIVCLKDKILDATGIEPELSNEPLLAVSRGAAIEGSSIKMKKVEVSPYSFGLEVTTSGTPMVHEIVKRNVQIPFSDTYDFFISSNGQKLISTSVYQDAGSLPIPSKKIGTIEMRMGAYVPKQGEVVKLRVTMNNQSMLKLDFSLPNAPDGTTFSSEVKIKDKKD